MTWMDPTGYADMSTCDYCECEFLEDELAEYEKDKWACKTCRKEQDEYHRQLKEVAEDDMAHAQAERLAGY